MSLLHEIDLFVGWRTHEEPFLTSITKCQCIKKESGCTEDID